MEILPDRTRTVFQLIGRIRSKEVQELKTKMDATHHRIALDLEQVGLVDLDAVHFLAAARRKGIELRNLPEYVRRWILLEERRLDDLE